MTLQKMYLVPADQLGAGEKRPPPRKQSSKLKQRKKGAYDKWVQFRENMRELDAKHAMKLKSIAELLKKVLPDATSRALFIQEALPGNGNDDTPVRYKKRVLFPADTYSTPPQQSKFELAGTLSPERETVAADRVESSYDDDDDVARGEEDMSRFGRTRSGLVAAPFLTPYNKSFLDKQYGIRKEGDIFKIGDSTLSVDNRAAITIKGKEYW